MNSALRILGSCTLLSAVVLLAECSLQATQAEGPPPDTTGATNPPAASTNQLAVTPPALAVAPVTEKKLSEQLQELVKMAERGLGEEVLIAWIKNSPTPFIVTPDDIVYLTDLGISEAVIKALLDHKGDASAAVDQPAQPAPPPINPPVGQVPPEPTPTTLDAAPAVTITATPEFETAPQTPVQPSVTYVQQPAPVQVNYFYSSLAPYGSWIEVPDYGLCWRPTVAVIDVGWRPYCHRGRWLYTNTGWYWQSDYTWGWAPFHYGRWWNHPRCGWVWAPDSVWSPAWVTWRYSDAYCGWAPLPPGCGYRSGLGLTYYSSGISLSFDFGLGSDCYTFVPGHRFRDRAPWRHSLPRHQVVNVFNKTTVINNITHNSDNTLVNEGLGRDRIARITRSEVPKVNLRDVPTEGSRIVRSDRLERGGKELAVYRPLNPTLPPEGSKGALARNEVSKTPAALSPRALESSAQAARSVNSIRSENSPAAPSITRLSPSSSISSRSGSIAGSAPITTTGTPAEASVSKAAVENRESRFTTGRRTLNNPVPVLRSPGSSATLSQNQESNPTSVAPASASPEERGRITSQPSRISTPINPVPTRAEPRRTDSPATATASPADGSTTIKSSRRSASESITSGPGTIQHRQSISKSAFENRSPAPSAVLRSVPSESASFQTQSPQPISPPLINQRPQQVPRTSISSASPVTVPSPPRAYQDTPRTAPAATPSYRQEVTKPIIVSRPRTESYSAPPAAPQFVPRSAPSYSPPPSSIQSVPRSSPGPISSPQPTRAAPVYSAPQRSAPAPSRAQSSGERAAISTPRAVTSQPSPSGRNYERR